MQNNIIENHVESISSPKVKNEKTGIWKWLKMDAYFNKENLGNSLPFIFFFGFLLMVYISNNYYAEKTIREKEKIKNELKELRSEYISVKSALIFGSKQSEVAKIVAPMGIKESVVPPQKITE